MGQSHKHEHEHGHVSKRRLHKDWRVWAALVLMLAAMLAYVLSDDESLQPGGGRPQATMPAAAGS
jgi:hypothetical protein